MNDKRQPIGTRTAGFIAGLLGRHSIGIPPGLEVKMTPFDRAEMTLAAAPKEINNYGKPKSDAPPVTSIHLEVKAEKPPEVL